MSKRVDKILASAAKKASEATGGTAKPDMILSKLKRMYQTLPSNQRQEFLDTLMQVDKHKVPKFTVKRRAWLSMFLSALFCVISRRFRKMSGADL